MFKKLRDGVWACIRFPFRVLKRLVRWVIFVIVFAMIALGGIWTFEYVTRSHQFSAGESCAVLTNEFFERIIRDASFAECLSTERLNNNKYLNYLILFADRDRPSTSDTGHGYIGWMRLSHEDPNLLYEFETVHWGPAVGADQPQWYSDNIAQWLPFSLRTPIGKFFGSLGLPAHYYSFDPPLRFEDPDGRPLTSDWPSKEELNRFIRVPRTVLVVSVDDHVYERLPMLKRRLVGRNWSLLFNDCTALVAEAADMVGLYVPPRIFSPYPTSMIERIHNLNRK